MIVEYIRYQIPEDQALRGFRGSPEFRSFFAALSPYVDNIEEMRHYDVKTAGPQ